MRHVSALGTEGCYGGLVRKLLLIAPTCNGEDVGEAWLAYQWAVHLAPRYELTVLTYYKRGHTPAAIQLPEARVVEWAEPVLLGKAERFNSMAKPGYGPFYFRARHWLRQSIQHGESFDVAFQPAPVAMRYPSPAAGLGIPFIIGPVGGSLSSPMNFRARDQGIPWYMNLRKVDNWRLRHDRLLRSTYQQASCVLGIAPYVQDQLSSIRVRSFRIMSETGLDKLPDPVDRGTNRGIVQLLFVGRLVPTKGAQDAIRSLTLIRDLPVRLDIVGDGFDRPNCEALTREYGLGDRVSFHGHLPRAQVDEFYRKADVFIFPSYREPGGNVAFEAMGYELPLIVSDIGGPGSAVDGTCALRVTPHSPDQYAADIATAVRTLVRDPQLRQRMGAAARRRVTQIGMWQNKARQLEALVDEVLEHYPAQD